MTEPLAPVLSRLKPLAGGLALAFVVYLSLGAIPRSDALPTVDGAVPGSATAAIAVPAVSPRDVANPVRGETAPERRTVERRAATTRASAAGRGEEPAIDPPSVPAPSPPRGGGDDPIVTIEPPSILPLPSIDVPELRELPREPLLETPQLSDALAAVG